MCLVVLWLSSLVWPSILYIPTSLYLFCGARCRLLMRGPLPFCFGGNMLVTTFTIVVIGVLHTAVVILAFIP